MKRGITLFIYVVMSIQSLSALQTTLLIKIPTRGRPHQFFRNLDSFYQMLSFKIPYTFLITCDTDDSTMNNPDVIRRLNNYPHLEYTFGPRTSKIEAFNRDIDALEFDIVLAAHDDMQALVKNFDIILVETMMQTFPDLDGVLNCNDGFVGRQCNTLPVIGRTYFKRFDYIYNPAYKALVANLELTNVSKMLKKEKIIDQVLIRHNHPAWGAAPVDELYQHNEKYHTQDLITFIKRRAKNFELSQEMLMQATPKLWSILICTIDGREESFNQLCTTLTDQITGLGLQNQIEILAYQDKKGEHTVGFKRNALLEQSQGAYVSFIDDDDDVHEHFVQLIYEKLCNNPDCVSLVGIITFNGTNPKKFIHSIQYSTYFEQDNVYFRPPNHLNPIKRSIAVQFSFPEKNFGEDADWTLALAQSKLLKKEERIDIPYYFYVYTDKK